MPEAIVESIVENVIIYPQFPFFQTTAVLQEQSRSTGRFLFIIFL